jgi:hypothetical protein
MFYITLCDDEECRLLGYKGTFRTSQETHSFSATQPNQLMLCYEKYRILGLTPRGSCKNLRFGGTYRLHHQGGRSQRARNNVSSN